MLATLRVYVSEAICLRLWSIYCGWDCDRIAQGLATLRICTIACGLVTCGFVHITCGLVPIAADGSVGAGAGSRRDWIRCSARRIDITCHIFCLTECTQHVVAFHLRQY